LKDIIRYLIAIFDNFLSIILGVKIFSNNKDCIFRYRPIKIKKDIYLPNGKLIKKGEKIVELHFWNEHLPFLSPKGADLFWGSRFKYLFFSSLKELLIFLENSPYRGVNWLFGETAFFFEDQMKVLRFLSKLGFIVYPLEENNIFKRFYRFLQNGYSYCLIYAYNPNSLKGKNFFNVKRYHLWISKDIIKSHILKEEFERL
jgi:hypothetical protein